MKTNLKIITPNGIFFEDQVDIVTLKTVEGGYIGLQHGRTPFTASLDIAPLTIGHNNDPNRKDAAIGGGIVVATKDNIEIITSDIIFKEDIDLSSMEKDKSIIDSKLRGEKDTKELLKLEIELKRVLNKIKTKQSI